MKKSISIAVISLSFMLAFVACGTQTQKEEVSEKNEKPSVAQLHAYKAMHHAIYMKTTAAAAGGTITSYCIPKNFLQKEATRL